MRHPILAIAALILAGEVIFALPFHIPRFFRATLLEVFGFTNADLGDVFAVYGVTAMIAYFPGGAIADRYPPHKLMAVSLFATALGGIYMATIPGYRGMSVLFAYWGVTSILLFWAALIRGTREWGGDHAQGRAFGILDGGRGLAAAAFASIAVIIFARGYVPEPATGDPAMRRAAFIQVVAFYTALTFIVSAVSYWLVPRSGNRATVRTSPFVNMGEVMSNPVVWAQALIVVCAYCGYKALDNYSLYAVDVLGMSEVDSAAFTAKCAYLRPIAAVAAGLIADRFSASRVMLVLFATLALSFGPLAAVSPEPGANGVIVANILLSFAGVFALRGVYFALLEETQVPQRITGTAVGLVSVIGYTPDVFFAAIGGRLIDGSPGVTGHQHYFAFVTVIMLAGAIMTVLLIALTRRRQHAAAGAK
ncbi:MAG: MFS transporter [Gammaproteobacteria bacterium]|jgi:nitrate/nitrite transporter NarK